MENYISQCARFTRNHPFENTIIEYIFNYDEFVADFTNNPHWGPDYKNELLNVLLDLESIFKEVEYIIILDGLIEILEIVNLNNTGGCCIINLEMVRLKLSHQK